MAAMQSVKTRNRPTGTRCFVRSCAVIIGIWCCSSFYTNNVFVASGGHAKDAGVIHLAPAKLTHGFASTRRANVVSAASPITAPAAVQKSWVAGVLTHVFAPVRRFLSMPTRSSTWVLAAVMAALRLGSGTPATSGWRNLLSLVQRPLMLWAWGQMALQVISLWAEVLPQESALRVTNMAGMAEIALPATILAVFVHLLAAWWYDGDRHAKLGPASSDEAVRARSVKSVLQLMVWSTYLLTVCSLLGVSLSNTVLAESIVALLAGWFGDEIMPNVFSAAAMRFMLPFSEGDWVTLDGEVDGQVEDTNFFYTRIRQTNKSPVYVPNSKLMSMSVLNNSRMTNRRIEFEFSLRRGDIPMIPKIVQDLRDMLKAHQDVDRDPSSHRLVHWRNIGDSGAVIWLSCYTLPTEKGVSFENFVRVEQSILERASKIVEENGAKFCSSIDEE